MHRTLKSAAESVRYRKFIADRDRALERILQAHLRTASAITATMIDQVMMVVGDFFATHQDDRLVHFMFNRQQIQKRMDAIFHDAAVLTADLIRHQRVSTYTLAAAGESEAIARAHGKPTAVKVDLATLGDRWRDPAASGGNLDAKVSFFFNRLKAKVMIAFEQATVLEDSAKDAKDRIRQALPKEYRVTRPARELKPVKLKEAAADAEWLRRAKADALKMVQERLGFEHYDLTDETALSMGIIDDAAWSQVLSDYSAEYIPTGRSAQDFTANELGEVRYDWEVEKELTHDFVEQVRAGQVEEAKRNGITEFQWIAVIDQHTCERCCIPRDGLTTGEIETQLASGKLDPGECDAVVPPAHFNCRCTLAPMTSEMPEESPPDWSAFDDWLNG